MTDEERETRDLEADAEVLPERELMSLITPDATAGGLPPMPALEDVEAAPGAGVASDAADDTHGDAAASGSGTGTSDDRREHSSQSDSASAT